MTNPKLGSIRVSNAGDYDAGFYVEEYGYWGSFNPGWAAPAWDERGHADLCGPFATREAAQAALDTEALE